MQASDKAGNGIGQPVRRKEDFRLLTGCGCFADDLSLPGMVHAVIVRSPHAHARIATVDKTAALAAPGLLAVLTGADYRADGLGPIPHNPGLMAPPDVTVRIRGRAPVATAHYPLPTDKVRFVGEPVALIVAETIAAAKDAAELLTVAYEPLAAVMRAPAALEPSAPALWDDAPGNLGLDIELGDVLGDIADLDPLGGECGQIRGDARRLGLPPVAKGEAAGVLALHQIIDGVASQQDGEIRPRTLHRAVNPYDRVVLLLDRRAVGALDDAQRLHDRLLSAWR